MLNKKLLDILACPICKGDLVYNEDPESLDCKKCQKRYPVKDDIPVMLVDEAQDLKEDK